MTRLKHVVVMSSAVLSFIKADDLLRSNLLSITNFVERETLTDQDEYTILDSNVENDEFFCVEMEATAGGWMALGVLFQRYYASSSS